VAWKHTFQEPVREITANQETVYLTIGNSIVAIGTDGNGQWRFTTNNSVTTLPAVADKSLFVGSNDGYVYALSTTDGTVQWTFETEGWVHSSPAVVDGTVYIGGNTVTFMH
jgi:outer membrane protein assembly factor BamB